MTSTFFQFPDVTSFLSSLKNFAEPFATQMWPLAYLVMGLFIAALLARFLILAVETTSERLLDYLFGPRDSKWDEEATAKAITLHRRYKKVMSGRGITVEDDDY